MASTKPLREEAAALQSMTEENIAMMTAAIKDNNADAAEETKKALEAVEDAVKKASAVITECEKNAAAIEQKIEKSISTIDKVVASLNVPTATVDAAASAAVGNTTNDDPSWADGESASPPTSAGSEKLDIQRTDAAATPPPSDDNDERDDSGIESPQPLTQVPVKGKPATRSGKIAAAKTIAKKKPASTAT